MNREHSAKLTRRLMSVMAQVALVAVIVGVGCYALAPVAAAGARCLRLRNIGGGTLHHGLHYIDLALSVGPLLFIGLTALLYRTRCLNRFGFYALVLSIGLASIGVSRWYYQWQWRVLDAFAGDVLVLGNPIEDLGPFFGDLGHEAEGCLFESGPDGPVLRVLGRVDGLDCRHVDRVLGILQAKGYAVHRVAPNAAESAPEPQGSPGSVSNPPATLP